MKQGIHTLTGEAKIASTLMTDSRFYRPGGLVWLRLFEGYSGLCIALLST